MKEMSDESAVQSLNSNPILEKFETLTIAYPETKRGTRNKSLDFFRGFVIVALIWDYFYCTFSVMGDWCGPDNYYIGFEQIVMPMFYIAVGYSMQLTLMPKLQKEGFYATFRKQLKRSTTLFIFGT